MEPKRGLIGTLWGWQSIEKTYVFHRFFDGFGRSERSKTLKFVMNGQTCDKIRGERAEEQQNSTISWWEESSESLGDAQKAS